MAFKRQTDIQSYFSTIPLTPQQPPVIINQPKRFVTEKELQKLSNFSILQSLQFQWNPFLLNKRQLELVAGRLSKYRTLDTVQTTPSNDISHVSSIEFDPDDALFALSYSESTIEIHEFLPILLQHCGSSSEKDPLHGFKTDTLRLKISVPNKKNSAAKFCPTKKNVLACSCRNQHMVWLFDLETCSETEPTQVVGKYEKLATGVHDICFGSASHHNNQGNHLYCACKDGLGRMYDLRTRNSSHASIILSGHSQQRPLATVTSCDEHYVYIGYSSGEVAQFDDRMGQIPYSRPLHVWNTPSMIIDWRKSSRTVPNLSSIAASTINDILIDPFAPSFLYLRNESGQIMGIDMIKNTMQFVQDTSHITTEPSAVTLGTLKRQRTYGVQETVFTEDSFFSAVPTRTEMQRNFSLAAFQLRRLDRTRSSAHCSRTECVMLVPDPLSSSLKSLDIMKCVRKKDAAVQSIWNGNTQTPCAVAVHKPTNNLIVGLLNGQTLVLEPTSLT